MHADKYTSIIDALVVVQSKPTVLVRGGLAGCWPTSPLAGDEKKAQCGFRESNPGQTHGKRQFYHYTKAAWQRMGCPKRHGAFEY